MSDEAKKINSIQKNYVLQKNKKQKAPQSFKYYQHRVDNLEQCFL